MYFHRCRSILIAERRIFQRKSIQFAVQINSDRFRSTMNSSQHSVKTPLTRFDNIVKSIGDQREYRGLYLENGLKVLLISDESTDKAAACASLNVGHFNDPSEIPGLAHFLEHMLFLGTEKFPQENSYSAFLSENGGSSNAATYPDCTKFYFDIIPDRLYETLDRFSQFFIAPLFTESATEREINAVNSEHEKNLATDVWRIRQVNKELSNQEHPFSKFGTGNKNTLHDIPLEKAINVREELMKFHQKWYSANIMCLAVFGKESLDELEKMIVELFSQIHNNDIKLENWGADPFLSQQMSTKTFIIPVKDTRSLTISFMTPDLDVYYKAGPEHYISHLIGHEGRGSVLSELKLRGWCNNLVGGHSNTNKGFGFFEVMVDLTEEGMEHTDDIIEIIFNYINLMKKVGPLKWIFDEYRSLSEMQFRFKDKENPLALVSNVVHSMQIYTLEEVLSAPYILDEWRPDLIQNLWDSFTSENVRITIVGQKLQECNEKEKWYQTSYRTEKITKEAAERWRNCGTNANLHLPDPNVFIPTDFTILPIEKEDQKSPTIVLDNELIRVWHLQDSVFLKPKMILSCEFSNPAVYSDPLNCNLTHIFVQLFKDHLNEYLYAADLAGLRLSVNNTTYGISVLVSGYNHKQKVFLEKILDHLFKFEIDEKRFEILKEQYKRSLKNFNAEQPYQQAIYYLALILTEQAWLKQELIDATEMVTVDRLKAFVNDVLSRMHAECFIYGNVNREKAIELTSLIEQKLRKTNAHILPLLARQLLLKREYKLDDKPYLFETDNEFHKSSCSSLYFQCGAQDDRANVMVDLITQILSEPCYHVLRTKEQLGYIVFCGARKANGANGVRFIVQSTKHPEYVEERIELFLESMTEQLATMSQEDFEKHKEALALQKLEQPKRLSSQFSRLLNEISLQQYHFDRANVEVAILRAMQKEEVMEYYKNFISRNGPFRKSLSIHVMATPENIEKVDPEEVPEMARPEKIRILDLTRFKANLELFSITKPFINILPKGAKSKL